MAHFFNQHRVNIFLQASIVLMIVSSATIDTLIKSAFQSNKNLHNADMEHGSVLKELDMMLTPEQNKALQEVQESFHAGGSRRWRRKALRNTSFLWPGGVIPYKIVLDLFSDQDLQQIKLVVQEWEQYTCIDFRRAESSDKSFVLINDGKGCYSYVGKIGGAQTLALGAGCRFKNIIVHELGHTVGFHHEQTRPDRDNYVTIVRENIQMAMLANFWKYPWTTLTTNDVPYDYRSIMHYGSWAFSSNGYPTMITKDPTFQNVIGNQNALSFNDIKLANLLYKCNLHCPPKKCPAPGFVGNYCIYWCPGSPKQRCHNDIKTMASTKKPNILRPTPSSKCQDLTPSCPSWKIAGYCVTNTHTKNQCRKSCGLCQ